MPGIGVRTAQSSCPPSATAAPFPTAAHLASYAGPAPTARRSEPRSTANTPPEAATASSNGRRLLSAFAALHDPASRTYYDRCRTRGKTHTQALLRLARQRISVLFAMLRDGTFYEARTHASLDERHRGTPARSTKVPDMRVLLVGAGRCRHRRHPDRCPQEVPDPHGRRPTTTSPVPRPPSPGCWGSRATGSTAQRLDASDGGAVRRMLAEYHCDVPLNATDPRFVMPLFKRRSPRAPTTWTWR